MNQAELGSTPPRPSRKKAISIILWVMCAGVIGFIGFIGFMTFMAYAAIHFGSKADIQDWAVRNEKIIADVAVLGIRVLPTWTLILGIFGMLPGTHMKSTVTVTETESRRVSDWAGLLSIAWMLSVFAIIHYIINPHHVTFGFLWILLFFLIGSQTALGFVLARIGLRSRKRTSRAFAAVAIGMFTWFLWVGFVPLVVHAF